MMKNKKQGMLSGGHYRIELEGQIESRWMNMFNNMEMEYLHGRTIISGPVTDQAALHGLLVRIRDLGLVLISLQRIEPLDTSAIPEK
ncbi:hypothetical protein ACFL45_08560 [Candidatus Neomarinimicrobiota bacterium]